MTLFCRLQYLTLQTFKRGKLKLSDPYIRVNLCRSYSQIFLSHSSQTCASGETNIQKSTLALFEKLQQGERSALARSITLVESQHPQKQASAQFLLSLVLKDLKQRFEKLGQQALSFRIGLTGPPGAGKSTFIETFGKLLTVQGHKVAVLAVDPSSSTTGGSLLGDKTRMPDLSADVNAFIRASPASGCLGGVTRSTNEAIALCECAGYDIIIVETVGVGQSEFHVASMVDMFAMIVAPAGGDELQGLKKGIVELADMVVVNKADGDLVPSARRIQSDYTSALKFVRSRYKVWRPVVLCVSSLTKDGIPDLWEEMLDFKKIMFETGDFELKRKQQYKMWMWNLIECNLLNAFKKDLRVKSLVSEVESQVQDGTMTPGQASDVLLKKFLGTG